MKLSVDFIQHFETAFEFWERVSLRSSLFFHCCSLSVPHRAHTNDAVVPRMVRPSLGRGRGVCAGNCLRSGNYASERVAAGSHASVSRAVTNKLSNVCEHFRSFTERCKAFDDVSVEVPETRENDGVVSCV